MQTADSPSTSLFVYPDLESVSRAAAEHVVAHIEAVLDRQERYALALAGGSTPRRLYGLLADVSGIPWERVHLFWGDERAVPHSHKKSNVRLVRETLLHAIDIPDANVHPIPTDDEAETCARRYARTLQRAFDDRRDTFDLALLGLGSDGHTASLFPEDNPSPDDEAWVRAVEAPPRHDVTTRLTCTLPVLNGASQALFLVAGARKRDALSRVIDEDDPSLPATHVRPQEQRLWFADADARPEQAL
jgi:6-phosphogluconolactonase